MSVRSAIKVSCDDLRAILATYLIRAALAVHGEEVLTVMGYTRPSPPFSPADQVRNALRAVADEARDRDIRLAATFDALAGRIDDAAALKLARFLKA